MRPRKVILCIDTDEQALGIRKFLLETRGYRVLTAAGASEIRTAIGETYRRRVDLLMCSPLCRDAVVKELQSGTSEELAPEAKVMMPPAHMAAVGLLDSVKAALFPHGHSWAGAQKPTRKCE